MHLRKGLRWLGPSPMNLMGRMIKQTQKIMYHNAQVVLLSLDNSYDRWNVLEVYGASRV